MAAEHAVASLLIALGKDPAWDHLTDTLRRVAKSYAELLTPPEFDFTMFPNDEGYDELVLARSIPVNSLSEHHLLPFHGVADVGYLPGDRILGLSKLARVVELCARDLQVPGDGELSGQDDEDGGGENHYRAGRPSRGDRSKRNQC